MNPLKNTDERRGATSASNALADSLCPARHLMQLGIAEEAESKDAGTGRRIHLALANKLNPDSLTTAEHDTFDACRKIEQQKVEQFFANELANKSTRFRVFREQRYWAKINHAGQVFEHSGQPDVVFRDGLRALIVEYKTLAGDVPESPKNLQLRDQAVLVRGNLMPIEEIGVVVAQPFVTMEPVIAVYSNADLLQAERQMFERVAASNNPESKPVAGEAQCKFCRATAKCVAYQKWAGAIAPPSMLGLLEVPMQSWTPAQCRMAAEALSPCQRFLDDLKDHLKALLERDPNSVPGWELKPGAVRESIKDPQVAFARFIQAGGTQDQFMACVSIIKGKLRDQLALALNARGKVLDTALKQLLDGIVEMSRTAPSLKRSDESEAGK